MFIRCLITAKKKKNLVQVSKLDAVSNLKFQWCFLSCTCCTICAGCCMYFAMIWFAWHVMLVFTSLGAHSLHFFLLSPLFLAASDSASLPCISVSNAAEAGVREIVDIVECGVPAWLSLTPQGIISPASILDFPPSTPQMRCKLTHLRC